MDIFEKAKKVGIDPCSSDGIDYETFYQKVIEAEKSSIAKKALLVSIGSFLISLISLVMSLLSQHY